MIDKVFRAHDHRSHRRPQPFAETELHRIEFLRHFGDVLAEVHRGVEDARAVQVDLESGFVSALADFVCNDRGIDGPAGRIVRVL